MAARHSAGLLLFRRREAPANRENRADPENPATTVEVLLGHMGGPLWARRDHAWTLPKGEYVPPETAWEAARREFAEELGLPVPEGGEPVPLGEIVQSGGKHVRAWALEADLDPSAVVPGTFTMEWPRGSGRQSVFPELDRVAWIALDEAPSLAVRAQSVLFERLTAHLAAAS